MISLIGSGTVEGTPQAVAAFLREHLADLDKGQLGEYLGHHEDFAVRVFYIFTLPWSAGNSFWRCLQGLDNAALQDLLRAIRHLSLSMGQL